MFIYILTSQINKKTYVGLTNDIERRLKEHNQGRHSYTKRYAPWKVLYKEEVEDRIKARKREKYLKSSAGRKWMKKTFNILRDDEVVSCDTLNVVS